MAVTWPLGRIKSLFRRPRVQSFWHGSPLSPFETLCVRSFLANGYDFDLYSFDRGLDVPDGCRLCDASELFTEDQVVCYKSGPGEGSVSLFSNMFRYKLLYEKAGWWVDMDLVCLRPMPDADWVFGYQEEDCIAVGAIHVPGPGELLLGDCLHQALEIGEAADWGDIGPALFTRLVNEHDLTGFARPVSEFYAHNWTTWQDVTDILIPERTEQLREVVRNGSCIHLWNELLRRENVDKWAPPPSGSLMADLMARYPP